ncbi:MAG: 16S rRNA (cytosine(967)-C(5))-methyltransferase RsmB [Clostridia bacterium]|nr:16S rRNA (cytosine(967)-C(5))-methyltransferase RsmB [Clostridia bacterium]
MTDSRITAYNILLKCEKSGAYSNIELSGSLSKANLDDRDKAFVTNLTYGVLSRLITLDAIISKLYNKNISKLDKSVLVILRMGLYQLKYMDKVPENAAVYESVELCKKFVNRGAAGLVNGILRSFVRSGADVENTLDVQYSCDESICEMLISQYGEEVAKNVLDSFFTPRKIYATVNTLAISVQEIAKKHYAVIVDEATVEIKSSVIDKINDSNEFFVQDITSSKAVEMLSPEENDTLADICAAPGGKSLKAAIMMKNKGSITSFDLHSNKLLLLDKSAKRLGIDIIKTAQGDGTVRNPNLADKFDKIICDVPCSGLGVIARKPEIRYKKTSDFEGLYAVQGKILKNASTYLKKGGKLLYSTCTINKKENEECVKAFLENNSGYRLVKEKLYLPTDDNDGFYAAIIERI